MAKFDRVKNLDYGNWEQIWGFRPLHGPSRTLPEMSKMAKNDKIWSKMSKMAVFCHFWNLGVIFDIKTGILKIQKLTKMVNFWKFVKMRKFLISVRFWLCRLEDFDQISTQKCQKSTKTSKSDQKSSKMVKILTSKTTKISKINKSLGIPKYKMIKICKIWQKLRKILVILIFQKTHILTKISLFDDSIF